MFSVVNLHTYEGLPSEATKEPSIDSNSLGTRGDPVYMECIQTKLHEGQFADV